MKKIKNLLFYGLFILIVSCQTEKEEFILKEEKSIQSESIKIKGHNLSGFSNSFWERNSIEVCWENPSSDNETKRRWVQEQITNTWELNSGITFWNWGKCSSGNKGIRILIINIPDTQRSRVKDFGKSIDGLANGMVLDFDRGFSNLIDEERSLRGAAVHEFGHALGFAHEQDRNDVNCGCGEDLFTGSNQDLFITPCDINSVMNYCSFPANNGGELTNFDIQGIQSLYGGPFLLHTGTALHETGNSLHFA